MNCDSSNNGGAPRPQDYVPKGRDRLFSSSSRGKFDALELTLGPPCEGSTAEKPYKNRGSHGGTRPFLSLGCPPQDADGMGAYLGPPPLHLPPPVYPAVQNNTSQKRSSPAAVVGWPPVGTFRKKLAGASGTKQPGPETRNLVSTKVDGEKPARVSPKGLFVKINMDGIPIGRKVDLTSCENYEKLAAVVDELFRGLLAAQTDSTGQEAEKPITGLLDGTGEYTLVYEDYEGDRVLVGDVPWQIFVATARRLRVLKRSDLSIIHLGWRKQDKAP